MTHPTEQARLGLSICYDLRFPELYRGLMVLGDGAAEIVQRRIAGNNGGNRQESGRLEIDEILRGILRLQKQVDTLDKKLDRLAQPGARS